MRRFRLLLPLFLLFSGMAASAHAAVPQHWVGTWGAAPLAVSNKNGDFSADTTLRQTVHVSLGGTEIRIVLSNELGTGPLIIGGAEIALPASGGALQPGTATPVTFSGQTSTIIPPGAEIYSDPVAFKLTALSDLSISLFLPAQTLAIVTTHAFADTTGYQAAGNQSVADTLTDASKVYNWRFLKAVEVDAPANAAAIVTFGDSITDGAASTRDANARWPDVLAQRLQADKATRGLGILNEGIGGNRVLNDGTGPNALARFDRDVLAQSGVKYLVILESINDIGHTTRVPTEPVTAQQLIAGLEQLIERAHAHGIKVIGATLTPYIGAGYASPTGEMMREAVNAFIRSSGKFDGVVDFDKATRDPANPTAYAAFADSGDHLHPKDAGYKAMGDAFDLKLFAK